MEYCESRAEKIKIAYIGGGSRGWAWTLMNDLAKSEDMSGSVFLYDIDFEAAEHNEVIGNRIDCERWKYIAVRSLEETLCDADFVIISILPGTFKEMESDVHAPEEYGIYQSVGDTTGPGGFFRALRTVPMIQKIARKIKECCPDAWVINYTNPMAVCVGALYREFPGIKAFGCCHEVFGTQKLLSRALEDVHGIKNIGRDKICVNVVGINHFTWFTQAQYRDINLFEVYRQFVEKYYETGYNVGPMGNWMNDCFQSAARVRFDLFRRFGCIAAAGDRHLAEFMDKDDYLSSPEAVRGWMFGLTPVSWRIEDLKKRLARSQRLFYDEEKFKLRNSGEEGVMQMRALLGLSTLVTNVNLPNVGQLPNLPLGTIVETNAVFKSDMLCPVQAGEIPDSIYDLVYRTAVENNLTIDAAFSRDKEFAYECFADGHMLKGLDVAQKRELFNKMFENTKEYLTDYL